MPKSVKMRIQNLVDLWVVILKITIWSISAVHAVSPWIMASLNIIKYPIWVRVKSIQSYHNALKKSVRIAYKW